MGRSWSVNRLMLPPGLSSGRTVTFSGISGAAQLSACVNDDRFSASRCTAPERGRGDLQHAVARHLRLGTGVFRLSAPVVGRVGRCARWVRRCSCISRCSTSSARSPTCTWARYRSHGTPAQDMAAPDWGDLRGAKGAFVVRCVGAPILGFLMLVPLRMLARRAMTVFMLSSSREAATLRPGRALALGYLAVAWWRPARRSPGWRTGRPAQESQR